MPEIVLVAKNMSLPSPSLLCLSFTALDIIEI